MNHLSILFYYINFSVTLNYTEYQLERKKIKAKVGEQKNNFLPPFNHSLTNSKEIS